MLQRWYSYVLPTQPERPFGRARFPTAGQSQYYGCCMILMYACRYYGQGRNGHGKDGWGANLWLVPLSLSLGQEVAPLR